MRAYEVEGRKLFIPVIALNACYEWSSGNGHSGASFLVGRESGDEEKMAPFRTDLGPRVFKDLARRRHNECALFIAGGGTGNFNSS